MTSVESAYCEMTSVESAYCEMTTDYLVKEILEIGLDDWIQASEVVYVVRHENRGLDYDQVRSAVSELVRKLLDSGLVEVGDLGEHGFSPWSLSNERIIEKIEQDWETLGREPTLWELFWLNLTPEGEALAKRVCA